MTRQAGAALLNGSIQLFYVPELKYLAVAANDRCGLVFRRQSAPPHNCSFKRRIAFDESVVDLQLRWTLQLFFSGLPFRSSLAPRFQWMRIFPNSASINLLLP